MEGVGFLVVVVGEEESLPLEIWADISEAKSIFAVDADSVA